MSKKFKIGNIVGVTVLIISGVLLSPILLLYFLVNLLVRIYVRFRIIAKWPNKKYILFVYSESKNWAPYIEENILPLIKENAVVINRTIQQNWKNDFKLEKQAIEL